MAKIKGLGRGLEALLDSEAAVAEVKTDLKQGDLLGVLPVEQLQPGKYQPRTRMDTEALTKLADSIRAQGVMQPILVRRLGVSDRFEIIAGERRWRASQLAGLSEVPVIIRDVADEAALAISLIENIQRENLGPLEEAHGIKRLIDEFGMTHQSASEAIGRSRVAVTNILRLLNLTPPAQNLLSTNQISMGHARALLSLDESRQARVAEQVASRQLSVRETENLVKKELYPTPVPSEKKMDPDLVRMEEQIAEKLGVLVRLEHGKGGAGKLVLKYNSLDQLDGLLSSLGVVSGSA